MSCAFLICFSGCEWIMNCYKTSYIVFFTSNDILLLNYTSERAEEYI